MKENRYLSVSSDSVRVVKDPVEIWETSLWNLILSGCLSWLVHIIHVETSDKITRTVLNVGKFITQELEQAVFIISCKTAATRLYSVLISSG